MGSRNRRRDVPAAVPPDHDAASPTRVNVEPPAPLEPTEPPELRGRGSVLVSAALGAALTPLNSTMVAVALPALAAEFGAPAASVTIFVVTGYLVATIVSQMPAGSVADRVGYTRALTWGRWLFGAGAIVGAVA